MNNSVQYLSINELIPGNFQTNLDSKNTSIETLNNSIKEYGILEPLIVRKKNNKYEIILGNKRYKSALNLGIDKVPVIILDLSDEKSLEFIISDKVQKNELTDEEEAKLYKKALSYPNITPEKLSKSLGIPLDRINSKLNLLNSKQNKKELSKEISISNYDNEKNSESNDIINLSELDKEEERDDYIMNNNQFINNDNSLNQQTPQPTIGGSQEPTFGGRFFPSLEDEPTNMNLSGNIGIVPTPQPQPANEQPTPLIDLTDLSLDNQPTITPQPISNPVPQAEFQPTIPSTPMESPLATEQPTPGIIPTSQPLDLGIEQNSPVDQPISLEGLNQPEQPIMDNNFGIPQNSNIEPQVPPMMNPPTMDIPNQTMNQQIPTFEQSIPGMNPISSFEQTPPQLDPMMNQAPISLDNNISMTPPTIDNQPVSAPMDINNNPVQTESKDIMPVVNMLKNIANSIEGFGYKLNITENDLGQTYNLTIEIQK